MAPSDPTPVQTGDTIHVPHHAWSFGTGTLHLTVDRAGPPFVWHHRTPWQEVEGMRLGRDGQPRERWTATVRLDAVTVVARAAVRSADAGPSRPHHTQP